MESEWDPRRFHDTHREKVEALIAEKSRGHEIVIQSGPEPAATVVDLMDALNASIAAAVRPGSKDEARPRATTKKATAKKTGSSAADKASKQAKAAARSKPPARRKAS
jgi:DNA end-binding protein Ku